MKRSMISSGDFEPMGEVRPWGGHGRGRMLIMVSYSFSGRSVGRNRTLGRAFGMMWKIGQRYVGAGEWPRGSSSRIVFNCHRYVPRASILVVVNEAGRTVGLGRSVGRSSWSWDLSSIDRLRIGLRYRWLIGSCPWSQSRWGRDRHGLDES